MKLAVEGLDKLNEALKNLTPKAKEAFELQLKIVATDLQGKAQELAPVDTGDLRGSAFAVTGKYGDVSVNTKPDAHPESQRGEIPKPGDLEAYVGFAEPYALRQHEDTELNHPQAVGKYGRAKFLEIPLTENRDKYLDRIGKAIKEAVEK